MTNPVHVYKVYSKTIGSGCEGAFGVSRFALERLYMKILRRLPASTTRLICSIIVFVCLLAINNFSYGDCWDWISEWNPVGSDCNWNNPENWSCFELSEPCGDVVIPPGPIGPCINGDASCCHLMIWSWIGAPDCEVDVYSGNVLFGHGIEIATWGTFDSDTSGKGILKVFGGTVTAQFEGAFGMVIGSQFDFSYGRVIMYGGNISMPAVTLYYGDITLYGGTLECTADGTFIFNQDRPQNKINVTGGTLKLKGNHATELSNYIASGHIVCLRGGELGTPVYNGTWTTLTGTADFNLAWGPTPEDNATNVHYRIGDVNVPITLSWNAGEPNVIAHAVYFGTSTGTLVYQGTRYDANADPHNWTIANFNFNNYYWRIDEVKDTAAVSTGKVWKFTTHDGKAYNPNPFDTKVGLSEPLQLSWTAGDFAVSHRVFFGTLSTGILNASTSNTDGRYRGTVSSPFYPLSRLAEIGANPPGASYTLVPGTTYYWRIDEVNGTTVWKGTVWSFTPAPYVNIDDFEDYNSTAELQAHWATTYPVNCDADYPVSNGAVTFVRDADGKHMRFHYYDKGGLGDLWFSEARYAYNPGTSFTGSGALNPATAALYVDYLGVPTNSVNETYDRMYVAIQDTAGNIGIVLNPDGNAALVTDWTTWYIALRDFNTAPNPTALKLSDINAFYLGFGVRCLPGPGGDGNVMFDNIRLHPQICNPDYGPSADLDGDCYVDIKDLDILADYWLQRAELRTFVSYSAPSKAPILWYKFDDTDLGGSVIDYGTGDANNYEGTVTRFAPLCWNATAGRNGGPCLYLPSPPPHNSHPYVNVPVSATGFMGDSAHSLGGGGVTFSVWANASFPGDFYTQQGSIFGIWNTNYQEYVEIPLPSRLGPSGSGSTATMAFTRNIYVGYYHLLWATASTGTSGLPLLDFGGRWNHWVFRKTPTQMAVYLNGYMLSHIDTNELPGDPNSAVYGPLWDITDGGVTAFRIGQRGESWGEWAGYIADFQMYDYALSDAQIAYLASDGTGSLLLSLDIPANLKSSGNPATEIIDFQDFAVLAQQWRLQLLWP